ncbi:uncharacterized protein LOC116342518 [Contarinia nasturtii]|uniref:uncharacterized protein LOC116342518 n=1 Tax=Contarinia nasturtii TaxID=265458 RepID=UPI0012D46885|nr:uncharacterized protein LOC116342518 [Contarinia nasturtii]
MFKVNRSVFALLPNVCAHKLQLRLASNDSRQSRMLQKLLTGKRKPFSNNFKWVESSTTPKFESINTMQKKTSKMSIRRTSMLNKMFMRHITDIIASGEIGEELCGLGLQITRVEVCLNYQGLNIHWTASETNDLDRVEQKLESIKKRVRHELHQMQLMGKMPHLTFVRDNSLFFLDTLNNVIENADYGDDFKPTLTRIQEQDFENQTEANKELNESSLPSMRNDVFGIDHALFMGRVKQHMAQSKQAWKRYEETQLNPTTAKPFTFNTSFESIRQEQANEKQTQDVLKEFLLKRKLLRKQKRMEEAESNLMGEDQQEEDYEDEYVDYDVDDDFEVEYHTSYDEHNSHER